MAFGFHSVIEESQGRNSRQNGSRPQRNTASCLSLHGLFGFLAHTGPLALRWYGPQLPGPPRSTINHLKAPQICMQVNLMKAFSQLKVSSGIT